jgi:hypothetical protein
MPELESNREDDAQKLQSLLLSAMLYQFDAFDLTKVTMAGHLEADWTVDLQILEGNSLSREDARIYLQHTFAANPWLPVVKHGMKECSSLSNDVLLYDIGDPDELFLEDFPYRDTMFFPCPVLVPGRAKAQERAIQFCVDVLKIPKASDCLVTIVEGGIYPTLPSFHRDDLFVI